MPDNQSFRRPPFPARLEVANCRIDGQDGEVTLTIANARHFADIAAFAAQHGRTPQFNAAILRLIGIAVEYAASQPPTRQTESRPDGTTVEIEYPARTGHAASLTVAPDWPSEKTPSLSWFAEQDGVRKVNGGCVWDPVAGTWGIHT